MVGWTDLDSDNIRTEEPHGRPWVSDLERSRLLSRLMEGVHRRSSRTLDQLDLSRKNPDTREGDAPCIALVGADRQSYLSRREYRLAVGSDIR